MRSGVDGMFAPPEDALCSVFAKYLGQERVILNGTSRPGDRLQIATDATIKRLLTKQVTSPR